MHARRGWTGLAYLCTPTDVFTVPKDAVAASHAHYSQRSFLSSLVSPFGMLQPNHVRGRSSPPAPMPWPC